MKFKALQERLRQILWTRIEAGELTGLKLADQTGFQQAHISNFLNRKRGLSLAGMDKVLAVQHLSVLDLLDPAEVNQRASILPPSEGEYENVVLVAAALAAATPLIVAADVREVLKFKKNFLRRLRAEAESDRRDWTRFVLIKLDPHEAQPMYPRLLGGATVLLDRHYNALKPYRKAEPNMYAVLKDDTCTVRYVSLSGNHLVLRPHNQAYPVDVIPIELGRSCADYLIGRVCHVAIET
jgi:hypothetical protein